MELLATFQFYMIFTHCIFAVGYAGQVIIKRLEMCDPSINYTNKIYTKFRTVNNQQFVDVNITLGIPFDDSIQAHITTDMLLDHNRSVRIVNMDEKKVCTATHKYYSEFAYDMERRFQLIPGMCPIPNGTYRLHNYPLTNYQNIAVPAVPYGNLLFTISGSKKDRKVLYCFVTELENKQIS